MNRDLHVERLYSLGDYKNIKFSDVISDLPKEVMFNNELIEKIQFLQMINMERMFRIYLDLNRTLGEMNSETIAKYLEEVRLSTLEDIKNLMNGTLKDETAE